MKDYWARQKTGQLSQFSLLNQAVEPSKIRMDFDLAVCKALKIDVTKYELTNVYGAIINEMIITRGLTRD